MRRLGCFERLRSSCRNRQFTTETPGLPMDGSVSVGEGVFYLTETLYG